MLDKLPTELLFKIVREYINYEEKVRLMNDPFFNKLLLTDYAWQILPKMSLQCLSFISKHYLHVIASGFYVSKTSAFDIFTVFINKQTGSVLIKGYEGTTPLTAGLQKVSTETHYQTVLDLKEMLIRFKRSYHFIPDMKIDYITGGLFFSNAIPSYRMFRLNKTCYMCGSKTLKNLYEYDSEKNVIKTIYYYKKRNILTS